jgi:hypothetical protein
MLEDRNIEVKHLLKKQNESIRNLIINKTHLIEGSAMPDSFAAFFSSTMIFDLYAAAGHQMKYPNIYVTTPEVRFHLTLSNTLQL